MGLSIHYSGQLKEPKLLIDLIDEVKDVAIAQDWKFHICNTVFPQNSFSAETTLDEIYGISFTPENCETLSLTFLSNGEMVCPTRIHFFADSKSAEERAMIYINSVKTQYAGVRTHQLIVILFKYLNDKYFSNFEFYDESEYWETNDVEKMKSQFQKYDSVIDDFTLAFETFPAEENEYLLAYIERLMKKTNKLKK